MTRSYSLAPGGWVGNTPGRSGDTQTEENAFEGQYSLLVSSASSASLPAKLDLHHPNHPFIKETNGILAKQSIEEEQKGKLSAHHQAVVFYTYQDTEHEDFIELLTQINHRNTLQLKELNCMFSFLISSLPNTAKR